MLVLNEWKIRFGLPEQTSHSVQSPKHTKICLTDMPRLSQAQRNQAIGMLRAGVAPVAVSRVFGCSRITIFNLITRMQQTGDVADRPMAGRPRVTTLSQDRAIRLTHLRDRFPAGNRYGTPIPRVRADDT